MGTVTRLVKDEPLTKGDLDNAYRRGLERGAGDEAADQMRRQIRVHKERAYIHVRFSFAGVILTLLNGIPLIVGPWPEFRDLLFFLLGILTAFTVWHLYKWDYHRSRAEKKRLLYPASP